MSTGKRLAKRSILGTRIVAPGQDGRFYPAVIQNVSIDRLSDSRARYTVRFDNSRKVSEFMEKDLIGPGFSCVNSLSQLMPGQRVYLTHVGREMEGTIMSHDANLDQVLVGISNGIQLTVRLEDIRLLESRKSSRLMNQTNTDFSKLADFNIVHERKRLNSEKSSDGSDFLGSRKRRGSETMSEEEERSSGDEASRQLQRRGRRSGQRLRKEGRRRGEECDKSVGFISDRKMFQLGRSRSPVIMTECTAAMVLMDLSCPANRGRMSHASGHSDASSGQMSPSSSGVSSLGTSWSCPSPTLTPPFPLPPADGEDPDPVEALLQLAANVRQSSLASSTTNVTTNVTQNPESPESDEGIVSDQSNEFEEKKTERVQTIYQCTWPGCHVRKDLCPDIERHVREKHLRRPAPSRPEDDDHEEEFYYNEIDIPLHTSQPQQHKPVSLCKPPPAHVAADKTLVISPSSKIPTGGRSQAPIISDHMDMARPPHENPEYGGARAILPANSPAYATIISSNGTPLQWSPEGQVVPLTPETAQAQATNLTTTNNPSSAAAAAATLPAPPCPTGHGPAAPPAPMHAVPIAIPITTFTIASSQHSPGKYIRLSPKPYTTSPKSPLRRPRGDAKKCRKVYGMEHRELWCTQCKWKKACTRFGEGA